LSHYDDEHDGGDDVLLNLFHLFHYDDEHDGGDDDVRLN